MSDYKVPYTKILRIDDHSGADRLELATVYGFQVVVQKGRYQVGDKVVYIPIDSVLDAKLETILFPPESKIKLHGHRVKQIRIRGLASQGMLVDPKDVAHIVNPAYLSEDQDLSEILNITKYEPPVPGFANTIGKDKQRNKKEDHPLFHKYNGLNNIKWFPYLFEDGEEVVVQEKLHGSLGRISLLPYHANTLWKKFRKLVGLAPKHEYVYGSNNVEISSKSGYTGFYGSDIYGTTFKKIEAFKRIEPGEVVFGEIIGEGIQKNYHYGHKDGHHFVVFDVKVLQPDGKFKWLNPEEAEAYALSRGFSFVPVLYKGPYNKEFIKTLTTGPSVYYPKHSVREGVVIKSRHAYDNEGNKKALKFISEKYLDGDNSDFH
jgi:RNA ligase (TIGR02306 family)